MSTTAGAASQEYVAINQTAIATLLLGLASVSVVMANLLLVLPVVAVACGIVALRQISRSNGTQSGRLLTTLGMILGLGMLAYVTIPAARMHYATKAEEGRIIAAVAEFGKVLVARDYDRAASMVNPDFFAKKQLTKQDFAGTWEHLTSNPYYGELTSLVSNGLVRIDDTLAGQSASTLMVMRFSKADAPMRRSVVLGKDDSGNWRIDDIPEVFVTPGADEASQ